MNEPSRAMLFGFLCAAAFTAPVLAANPVPVRESPEHFLARVDAAQKAARPATEIETFAIKAEGLAGTARVVRRGEDESETDTLGPIVRARGTLAGRSWRQNENGITIVEDPSPSPVPHADDAVQRVAAPHDLWLVTQHTAEGATIKTWYDATDLLKVREEIARGKSTLRVAYDDVRPYNGTHRRAWHEKAVDDKGDSYEATLQSDDVGTPIGDAALAIPSDARTLVEFPDGVNQVHLPARVTAGRIHVTLNVDGTPMVFVLDTGASGIVINDRAIEALKLPTYGASTLTIAGSFRSAEAVVPFIRAGSLVMRNVVVRTAPFDQDEMGDRVMGLLGFDFIAGAVLRIDYRDPGGVDAIRPSVFSAPPLASAAMPIRLGQGVPVVQAGVGNTTSDDMIVDTGAEAPVLFFDRFVRAHPKATQDEGVSEGSFTGTDIVYGVGGKIPIAPLRIKSFRFADLDFRHYVVLRATEPGAFGDYSHDGLLGALFLRFYTLYVDYPDRKLYFEPNKYYKDGVGQPIFLP